MSMKTGAAAPMQSIADLWNPARDRADAGGIGFEALIAAFRTFQDRFAGASCDAATAAELTGELDQWSARLAEQAVAESDRLDGARPDLPGRGSPLLPPIVILDRRADGFSAHVTFGRLTLGLNGAVHGGVMGVLFDELLGATTGVGDLGPARTVHLEIDFRALTPLDTELHIETRLDRIEGRKRYASGELRSPAGEVLAEATALCIALRPGQL